jgi:hypothetical protein
MVWEWCIITYIYEYYLKFTQFDKKNIRRTVKVLHFFLRNRFINIRFIIWNCLLQEGVRITINFVEAINAIIIAGFSDK